jgi:hypothetical protein
MIVFSPKKQILNGASRVSKRLFVWRSKGKELQIPRGDDNTKAYKIAAAAGRVPETNGRAAVPAIVAP